MKALEHLFKLIAEDDGPSASIKSEERNSSLLEVGLVNILFACLPKPEGLERSKKGVRNFTVIDHGFKEFVDYLCTAVGKEAMGKICGDPLPSGLFSTAGGVDTSRRPARL